MYKLRYQTSLLAKCRWILRKFASLQAFFVVCLFVCVAYFDPQLTSFHKIPPSLFVHWKFFFLKLINTKSKYHGIDFGSTCSSLLTRIFKLNFKIDYTAWKLWFYLHECWDQSVHFMCISLSEGFCASEVAYAQNAISLASLPANLWRWTKKQKKSALFPLKSGRRLYFRWFPLLFSFLTLP